MSKYCIILFLLALSGMSCASSAQHSAHNGSGESSAFWSVKMARTVMARYPVLTDMDLKFHNRSKPKWQYDIAMVAQAIDGLGEFDKVYQAYMQSYMDFFINADGQIFNYKLTDFNLDKINPGNNLIILYERTGDLKYKKAIDQLVIQLKGQPRNPDGGYWHKARYPYQMWLDGIYMSSPFMARYARVFDEPKWFDEVVRQITVAGGLTRDAETGLLYHACDVSRGMKWSDDSTGCSPHFWGRAMGWYMMAIVDALDYFPENHPGREKLIEILQRTSIALEKVRDKETGLWYQVLDMGGSPGNYLEASASCMFVYAFAKGAEKGYLDARYKALAETSFDSILKEFITIDKDGQVNIDQGCFAAGLGGLDYRSGSYEYYIKERKGMNDSKSIGPFILAAYELNR